MQIGGPTGAFIVIISSIYLQFGDSGLIAATLTAGVILILFGLFRMGALIKFIPFPVTTGFTSGIAVVIFATQLNDLFGLKPESVPADFIGKIRCFAANIGDTDLATLGVGIFTVVIICLIRRFLPRWPAMLLGMLAGTLLSTLAGLDVATIGSKFGELPRTLPAPGLHLPSLSEFGDLLMPSFTIALLAAIESAKPYES